MGDERHQWVEELKESLEAWRKVRDEARVHAHLATLDAKARIAELERRLGNERQSMAKNLSGLIGNFREIVRAARKSHQRH